MAIDIEKYEGAYTDKTKPGYHLVQLRGKSGGKPGKMVLKVPTLEASRRVLTCKYEILSDTIDDEMARVLIRKVLLEDFCDHFYDPQAEEIEFINLRSNSTLREPFLNDW